MFTLANSHSFDADPEMCSLWARYGYAEECFSWGLCLYSKNKRLRLGNETDEASFGISLHPPLGATDWRRLRESPIEVSSECLACSFYFHFGCYGEWEDLLSLDLRFGDSRAGRVEVWASGSGSVEAASDLFPDGQVEFQIHTWARFRGVAISVPLNASNPIASQWRGSERYCHSMHSPRLFCGRRTTMPGWFGPWRCYLHHMKRVTNFSLHWTGSGVAPHF